VTGPEYRWLANLPAATLRHLAALAEQSERPQFVDPVAAADELGAMLVSGGRPTIGWYRRHLGLDTVKKRRAARITRSLSPSGCSQSAGGDHARSRRTLL